MAYLSQCSLIGTGVFNSTFWKTLFQLVDTKLLMSSSYHPQTDGQTELMNQCLEMCLRCVVQDSPKAWKSWLSLAVVVQFLLPFFTGVFSFYSLVWP